jgi:hypothetical protein
MLDKDILSIVMIAKKKINFRGKCQNENPFIFPNVEDKNSFPVSKAIFKEKLKTF